MLDRIGREQVRATLLVRLRQMSADARQPVRLYTQKAANWHGQPQRQVFALFSGTSETVLLQKLVPGARIFCAPHVGGAEIHDVSEPDSGNTAIFGFTGVLAKSRWTVSDAVLKSLCREPLVRLFGQDAVEPEAEYIKDWAADPFLQRNLISSRKSVT